MRWSCLYGVYDHIQVMRGEDGVGGAVRAFEKHLPLSAMLCDVSLYLGQSALAEVFISTLYCHHHSLGTIIAYKCSYRCIAVTVG